MSGKGLLSRLFSKNKTNLTDEDRQLALQYRRMNNEARQAERMLEQQNRLLALKEQQAIFLNNLADVKGGKSEADDMLSNFMQLLLASKLQQPQQPTNLNTVSPSPAVMPIPQQEQQEQTPELDDEQILEIIESFPKSQRKLASKLDDNTLIVMVKKKFPEFNDATIYRALELFRSV